MEAMEIKMLEERIERLEDILLEINSKIENFMGYEDLTPEEDAEVERIMRGMEKGKSVRFEELFK